MFTNCIIKLIQWRIFDFLHSSFQLKWKNSFRYRNRHQMTNKKRESNKNFLELVFWPVCRIVIFSCILLKLFSIERRKKPSIYIYFIAYHIHRYVYFSHTSTQQHSQAEDESKKKMLENIYSNSKIYNKKTQFTYKENGETNSFSDLSST